MGLTKPRAAQIFDIDYKQATRVITVSNVTLTSGAPAVVDGVSLTAGDRVLVTGQSTGSENGLYAVAVVGVGSDGTWVRTSDGNEDGEIQAGMIVMVTEGTTYHDTQWKLTTDGTIDIGTTALVFELNTSGNSITNGTSNITVLNNANVNVNVTGSQVAAFASTGTYVTGLVSATGNVSAGNVDGTTGAFTTVTGAGSGITSLNADELSSGTVPSGRLSGTYTIDISGSATTAGTVTTAAQPNITSVGTLTSITVTANVSAGNITAGNVIVDTITIDAAAIATSGDLTLDSAGDITLNADGADIILADDTVDFGRFKRDGGDFVIKAETADKDIIFKGVKAGTPDTVITALSLDMSNDGRATFNENIVAGGTITGVTTLTSSGVISTSNTTGSTNTTSGALTVAGGIGVAENAYIGGNVIVTGNVDAGNVNATIVGDVTGNVTGEVTGNVSGSAATAGTVTTAAQPNITSVGTLTSVTASGNITTTGNININARQGLYLYDSDSSNYIAIVSPSTVSGNVTFTLPGDAGTADYVLATNGAGTLSWIEQSGGGGSGASSFPNSTVTPLPSSEGNFDLSYNYAQTTQETPFESGGTDAFGVSLGEVYSMMDPAGDIPTPTDLGILA
jgi:hypothetical protein